MKKLFFILILSLSILPGYALAAKAAKTDKADKADADNAQDNRIKLLMYDEANVYTITTKYGYETNIVFGAGEEIQTISVGDRSLWQIIPSANRLFIRPMEDDVTTNMTVLTSRHSYQFDLKSTSSSKRGTAIYVAKFVYPDDQPKQATASGLGMSPASMAIAAESTLGAPAGVPPAKNVTMSDGTGVTRPLYPNYDYTYDGPDDLAPLQVYDDGKSTFIKYSTIHEPLPNAYIVGADGKENPTTYYIKDNMMVIDNVVSTLALKNSNGTVTIYNEMMNPHG